MCISPPVCWTDAISFGELRQSSSLSLSLTWAVWWYIKIQSDAVTQKISYVYYSQMRGHYLYNVKSSNIMQAMYSFIYEIKYVQTIPLTSLIIDCAPACSRALQAFWNQSGLERTFLMSSLTNSSDLCFWEIAGRVALSDSLMSIIPDWYRWFEALFGSIASVSSTKNWRSTSPTVSPLFCFCCHFVFSVPSHS